MKTYTIKEVVDMLKISRITIWRRIKSGKIKAINIGTKERPIYRISEEQLNNFLNNE